MKLLILSLVITLTGCAGSLEFVANHYDRMDICQSREFANNGARLKPQGYQVPSSCSGSSQARLVTRDYYSNRPLTTTRIER
jgi:hypothetical protein